MFTSICRRCGRSGGGRMYKEIGLPSLPFSLLPSPSSVLPFPLLLPLPALLLSSLPIQTAKRAILSTKGFKDLNVNCEKNVI